MLTEEELNVIREQMRNGTYKWKLTPLTAGLDLSEEERKKQCEESLQISDAYQEILEEQIKAGTLDSIKDKTGLDQ